MVATHIPQPWNGMQVYAFPAEHDSRPSPLFRLPTLRARLKILCVLQHNAKNYLLNTLRGSFFPPTRKPLFAIRMCQRLKMVAKREFLNLLKTSVIKILIKKSWKKVCEKFGATCHLAVLLHPQTTQRSNLRRAFAPVLRKNSILTVRVVQELFRPVRLASPLYI